MLYAVIKRYDSLREIASCMLPEGRKLAHLGISVMPKRSTLSDANARITTYIDLSKERPKPVSLLTNNMEMKVEDIVGIYRQRWEIELLFKQIKQNFPLRYFYGESAIAIKIQILVTLIANLLLMVQQSCIKRPWNF